MGIEFPIEHASLVGWLTRRDFPPPVGPKGDDWLWLWHDYHYYRRHRLEEGEVSFYPETVWKAPRVPAKLLYEFLNRLPNSVISRHKEYLESLRRMVGRALDILNSVLPGHQDYPARIAEILPSNQVAQILAPLRGWFDVPFYFLPISPIGERIQRSHFERYRNTPDYTLWLACDDTRSGETATTDLLDPFPPLRGLFSANPYAPATLCWTWSGDSVVIPGEVERLLNLTWKVPPWHLWSELKSLHTEEHNFNLLQLSDLHFGANAVSLGHLAYVEQHLRGQIETVRKGGGVVQPVVTGDLMDTPSVPNLAEFNTFRNRLAVYANTPVIYIPGNHDVRWKGFWPWKSSKAAADLEWNSVVRSDVCKVVFLCFDTSRNANLARGKITDDQLLDVATKVTELKHSGDYSTHIFIALVHHHPFSTREDEVDTLPLGIPAEPFLRMENGDQLVNWCAANRVPLILHGHKHRPRFVGQEIEIEGRTRLVRAIGCGSTLGIEGRPLSFNWIIWRPATRSWMVSFYADPGDGSGFSEKRLAIGSALEQ